MSVLSRENIGWVDALRILACFLVVFSHSCDGMVAHFDMNREAFLTGVFSGSMVRSCVPLFVMMTGVLLLPTSQPMGAFYRKRIGRIVVPMLFWSLLLPILFFLYFNCKHFATYLSISRIQKIALKFSVFLSVGSKKRILGKQKIQSVKTIYVIQHVPPPFSFLQLSYLCALSLKPVPLARRQEATYIRHATNYAAPSALTL